MTQLRIQLLGGFSISLNGIDVLPGRRNTRTGLLLAYLLLKPGKRISRQHLAYTFWPDSGDVQARTNLRGLLVSLRKQTPELFVYIRDDDPYLGWRSDSSQTIDVVEFEAALQRADSFAQADREKAIGALKEAVSLYTGELLPGHYDEWVLAERQRLYTLYLDALMWLVEALEASGQMRDAIRWAETLLQADRLREQSHFLLMRLLAAMGDRARALAVYAECAKLLKQELGVEPGQHIEALHRRLLMGSVTALFESSSSASPAALVGRSQEWHRLLGFWRRAVAGNPQIVVLTGEAGIGKTRLARQLVDQCEREGVTVLTASCPQAKKPVAYLALASWLTSPKLAQRLEILNEEEATYLQLLSPSLRRRYPSVQPLTPLAPHWQRLHLYQSLAVFFTDPDEPMLLFLDDAQWCDEESLEWLHYLLITRQNARVLVILSVRTGEQDGPALALFRTELLARGWLQQIELGRLTCRETEQLVRQTTSLPLHAAQVDWLFTVSAGIPFFVIELTRMLTDASAHEAAPLLTLEMNSALPVTVSAIILHRLTLLSSAARQLLDSAAVIGGRFAGAVLRRLDRLTDDARVAALDELWRRTLLAKIDGDLYEFGHGLIREVVYQQLSEVRRRYLHGQAADALAAVYVEDLISHAAEIAWHLECADRLLEAAQFRLLAAARMLGVLSIDAAGAHLEHAIELLAQIPKSNRATELAFECWLQLGTLLLRHKGYDDPGAQHAFQQANAVSRMLVDPLRRFLALRGLWEVKWGTGQLFSALEAASELLEIAVTLLSSEAQAEAFWAQGATLFYLGEYARAEEMLRRVLDVKLPVSATSVSPNICHPTVAAQCYLAFIETICGDPDLGVDAMRAVAEAAEQHADPYTFLFTLTHLALLQHIVRDLAAVSSTSQRLSDLCAQYGFDGMALVASRLRSWAISMRADAGEEVDRLYQMVMDHVGVTAEVGSPIFVVALAEVLIKHGRNDDALVVVEAGLRVANRQGVAITSIDLHRLHGELLCSIGADPLTAEKFHQTALALALTQGARLYALRTVTGLSTLWAQRGRCTEAAELLQEVLSWFPAAPSRTADVEAARALLVQLT
jgi:DNA-binding SARP family transcriptional activator